MAFFGVIHFCSNVDLQDCIFPMKSPCKHPGCPELVKGLGYCQTHHKAKPDRRKDYDKARMNDPVLSIAARIRWSARWRRVSKAKLSANPLCEDPHDHHKRRGETITATQVHHIEQLTKRPELAYSMGNLMSLCTRCHDVFNRQERSGDDDL